MPSSQFLSRVTNFGVHNLSGKEMSPLIRSVLSCGNKFLPTPITSPTSFYPSLENNFNILIRNLCIGFTFRHNKDRHYNPRLHLKNPNYQPKETDDLREVKRLLLDLKNTFLQRFGSLPNTHSLHNLTRTQWETIIELRNHPDFIVIMADKNLGLILLLRAFYILHFKKTVLSNHLVYFSLDHDTDPTGSRFIISMLEKLKLILKNHDHFATRQAIMSDTHWKFIYFTLNKKVSDFKYSIIYGLLKYHKLSLAILALQNYMDFITFRPIVNAINSVPYSASIILDDLLKEIMKKQYSYLPDSKSLVRTLDNLSIPLDTQLTLATADVKELYPSIPTVRGVQLIRSLLEQENMYRPKIDFIIDLLLFVLNNNYVQFDNNYYRQRQGSAMGQPSAVTYANLFLASIETPWIRKYKKHIILYKRLLDDMFLLIDGDISLAQTMLKEFNELDLSIKITESISNSRVDFLDLTIYKSDNFINHRKLDISCFQKPLNRFIYIPYNSFHPNYLKMNFVKNELNRYIINNSEQKNFKIIMMEFFHRLRARGYPRPFLIPLFLAADYSKRNLLLHGPKSIKQANNTPRLMLEFNTLTSGQKYGDFFRKHWFNSDRIKPTDSKALQFLKSLPPPSVGYRYTDNIRNLLIRGDVNAFSNKRKRLHDST